MLTLDPVWYAEMGRSGSRPIYLVDMYLGPSAYILVIDFTLFGTQSITFTTDQGTLTLVAGTDFTAGTSNAQTAANIVQAFNFSSTFIGLQLYQSGTAQAGGAYIYAVPTFGTSADFASPIPDIDLPGFIPSATTISISSSSNGAWSLTPGGLKQVYSFCSGHENYSSSVTACVSDVTTVSNRLDIKTRQQTIGQLEIAFGDTQANPGRLGLVRNILYRSRWKGKLIQIRIGTIGMDQSIFAPVGTWAIDDVVMEPGKIVVKCVEPIMQALNAQVTGNYVCMHPLSIIRRILWQSGFPPSLLDTTSLDRSQSRYSAISHLAASRSNWYGQGLPNGQLALHGANGSVDAKPYNNGISASQRGIDVINDLSRNIVGTFGGSENGVYGFRLYDPTAAPVAHLGDDDIDVLKVESSSIETYNSVTFNGVTISLNNHGQGDNQNRTPLFEQHDLASIASIGVSGEKSVYNLQISSDWLGVPGFLGTESIRAFRATDTLLPVSCATIAGFAGTRESGIIPPHVPDQLAYDQLDTGSGRTAYLQITDGTNFEFVQGIIWSFTEVTHSNFWEYDTNFPRPHYAIIGSSALATGDHVTFMDPDFVTGSLGLPGSNIPIGESITGLHARGTYTVPADAQHRGLFGGASASNWVVDGGGSGAVDFGQIAVLDVTMPVLVASYILQRFAWGCPITSISVPIHRWAIQLGDFMTMDHDVYFSFNKPMADSSVVWEVIQKELRMLDDSPNLTMTLAWVRDDVSVVPALASNPLPVGSGPTSGGGPVAGELVTLADLEPVTTSTLEQMFTR